MTIRVTLQPAFVLHSHPYNDTSSLVDLFTMYHGRITALARGARAIRSRFRGLLRPFVPLLASWSGKTELMNLSNAESNGPPFLMNGRNLLSGMYLNELLVKLLHKHDEHPELFMAYQRALVGLQKNSQVESVLRLFERQLLSELGYGLQLDREASTGEMVVTDRYYRFDPQIGVIRCYGHTQTEAVFTGKNLLALQHNNFSDESDLKAAKRLMRVAIAFLMQGKPVHSFELFRLVAPNDKKPD